MSVGSGITKTLGFILLIGGILLVVAGIGGAVYGFSQQKDAEKGAGGLGVVQDRGGADQAQQILLASAIGGGVGLVATIVGGILLGVGGSLSRRALIREVRDSAAPASVVPSTPAEAAAPPASAKEPTSRARVIAIAAVVLVLLAGVVAAGLFFFPPSGSALRPGDKDSSNAAVATKFHPIFDSAATGAAAYTLATVPDDVAMDSRSLSEGNLAHTWTLSPLPATPLRSPSGTYDFHWVYTFNEVAVVTFVFEVTTDGGTAKSDVIEKTVNPGTAVPFDGKVTITDFESPTFAVKTTLVVKTGLPAVVATTELKDCYVVVPLL